MKDNSNSSSGNGGRTGLSAYLSPLAVIALSFGYAVGWGAFVLPGTVSIKRTLEAATTSEPEHYVITDTSSLKDEYVIAVIATWCNMRIGNPPNYDNLLKAYESMKGSMRMSRQYTRYGGGADECGC